MNDLKPCPFCGSQILFLERTETNKCYIACVECGSRSGNYWTKQDAIEAWNRRIKKDE